jgi:predicted nucleic acid-binding protein
MKYLLDVNTLIALGLEFHALHVRVARWVQSDPDSLYLTCPITELGFVRVIAQVPAYRTGVQDARKLLLRLKENRARQIEFVADGEDIASLPTWVSTPAQTTDGYLAQLATANTAVLATLDKGIPGAYLIP